MGTADFISSSGEKAGMPTQNESINYTLKKGRVCIHRNPGDGVSCRTREDRPEATRINNYWAMDFMSDELHDGRRNRLLTIVDHFTRESLAIDVGQRMRGNKVVSVLERVACQRKIPKSMW